MKYKLRLGWVFPGQPNLAHVASKRSLAALSWTNFFLADMLTGFGPFVALYLGTQHWSQTDVGVALSIGTVAAMVAQVPAGAMVDALAGKRLVTGIAFAGVIVAMLILVWFPFRWPVFGAEALKGVAAAVITPAVAALTLALANQEKLAERLGENVRSRALGSGLTALLLGSVGGWLGYSSVFYLGAAFGVAAIISMGMIERKDLETAPNRTGAFSAVPKRRQQDTPRKRKDLPKDRGLMAFAGAMLLFQLGNAAVLNIAAHGFSETSGRLAGVLVAASVAVPQVIAALIAVRLGNLAESWGRRRVLMLGFCLVPVRIVLFALGGSAWMQVGYQAFDGVTAAVLGLMIPLVVSDITHDSGRFSLGMGIVGLAVGIGATLSTTIAGYIADHMGDQAAYLTLAAFAVASCVMVWLAVPETRERRVRPKAEVPDRAEAGRSAALARR